MGLIISGVEVGIDAREIYSYTPAEVELMVESCKMREIRRYNDMLRVAYLSVYFDRQKKMPKLEDFIDNKENIYFPKVKKDKSNQTSEEAFLKEIAALNAMFGGTVY